MRSLPNVGACEGVATPPRSGDIDFAPGRPDLRPTADPAKVRAEHQANLRRRRLQAVKGENIRSLMRAPQGR